MPYGAYLAVLYLSIKSKCANLTRLTYILMGIASLLILPLLFLNIVWFGIFFGFLFQQIVPFAAIGFLLFMLFGKLLKAEIGKDNTIMIVDEELSVEEDGANNIE